MFRFQSKGFTLLRYMFMMLIKTNFTFELTFSKVRIWTLVKMVNLLVRLDLCAYDKKK